MSWQCPICETVNQDVTPVCTVCDHLSPVVDSFLSLESIEKLRDYNEKLEEVHRLEIAGKYDEMIESSIKAMSLYRDNTLAIEKTRQAVEKLQQIKLDNLVINILGEALDKKNLNLATGILKMIDLLEISNDKLDEMKREAKKKISRKKDVDEILHKTFLALVDLDTDNALRIVEEGLIIHSASKRLQNRRKEIQTFIQHLNKRKETDNKNKRKIPAPKLLSNNADTVHSETGKDSNKTIETKKRKFPQVKLKLK